METKDVLNELYTATSGGRVLETAREINRLARRVSFDGFLDTARFVAERLRGSRISCRLHEFPTTEKTGDGRRVMPEAWDVKGATLHAVRSDGTRALLTDYREDPFSIMAWSAPLHDATAAPVVVMDDAGDYASTSPEGRYVLTNSDDRCFFYSLAERGAKGIVIDSPQPGCPDAKRWLRFGWPGWPAWSRRRVPGFVVSQNEGASLRKALAEDAGLLLAGEVDSRFYTGALPVVDAVLEGEMSEEVVLVPHLFEPGALDNASGCAAVIHILETLADLVSKGRLRRPRRSIRAIFSYEVFGLVRFMREQPEIARRWRALLGVDCVGASPERSRAYPVLMLSSPAWGTWLDALSWNAQATFAASRAPAADWTVVDREYYLDDAVCNRVRGLPGVSFTAEARDKSQGWFLGYHSSFDTPELLDADVMREAVAVTGAAAQEAACVTGADAGRLAMLCEGLAREEVPRRLEAFRRLALRSEHPLSLEEELALAEEIHRTRLASLSQLASDRRVSAPSSETKALLREAGEKLRRELGDAVRAPGEASAVRSVAAEVRSEASRLIPVRLSAEVPCFPTMAGHGNIRRALGRDDIHEPVLDLCDGARSLYDAWRIAVRGVTVASLEKVLSAFRLYEEFGFVKLVRK